jgi:hypothetical protein
MPSHGKIGLKLLIQQLLKIRVCKLLLLFLVPEEEGSETHFRITMHRMPNWVDTGDVDPGRTLITVRHQA